MVFLKETFWLRDSFYKKNGDFLCSSSLTILKNAGKRICAEFLWLSMTSAWFSALEVNHMNGNGWLNLTHGESTTTRIRFTCGSVFTWEFTNNCPIRIEVVRTMLWRTMDEFRFVWPCNFFILKTISEQKIF